MQIFERYWKSFDIVFGNGGLKLKITYTLSKGENDLDPILEIVNFSTKTSVDWSSVPCHSHISS